MNINKVFISGNLTRDAEIRSIPYGGWVYSFCIAINNKKLNRDTGEYETATTFVDCSLFDSTGNKAWMTDYLKKGFKVYIEGHLRLSSWTSKESGKTLNKLSVIVNDIDAKWPKKGSVENSSEKDFNSTEDLPKLNKDNKDIPF